jgi:signal transduction histidine kinase
MNEGRRSIWREPRPADAPGRLWYDWVLVGGFELAAVLEAIFRPDVAWRLFVTVVALALPPVLLWRRSHPLGCALVGFTAALVLSVAQLLTGSGDLGLYSMGMILILLYSLVRWGSGREVVLGLAFVSVSVAMGMLASFTGWADVFGGSVFLLMFVALAAAFRYRADVWNRQKVEIRNQERVGLARELHDTVAHHVSAIAVQAQAGGVVAATQPERAVAVLAAIEAEASQTLAEMRAMVRVLRDGETVDYAPQLGISDLPALARSDATPVVEVRLAGSLTGVPQAMDAAVYRLAQESLTNAVRHARNATRIEIDVIRDVGGVRLRVADDGQTDAGHSAAPGFGLLGMTERAELLGGSLCAGPRPEGGWVVDAVLPVGAAG